MTHGTRASYQRGSCRCLICKAANAQYSLRYYRLRAAGHPRLVPAGLTVKRLKALRAEGLSYAEIARRFGLKCQRLHLHSGNVAVYNYLRVRRLYQSIMAEGEEL